MFDQILNTPLDDSLSNKTPETNYASVYWKCLSSLIYSSSYILLGFVAKSTLTSMLEETLDDPLMVVLKTIVEFKFFSPLAILMKTFRVLTTITTIILFYQGG